MLTAQEQIESWLTETLHRTIYLGNQITPRLTRVSEFLKESDEAAQNFIRQWLTEVQDAEIVYRSAEIQDRLLDLWALVANFQALVDGDESLNPSVV